MTTESTLSTGGASLRGSTWAEHLLEEEMTEVGSIGAAVVSSASEGMSECQQYFARVLRNLDRLENLAGVDAERRMLQRDYEQRMSMLDEEGAVA